jgi:hypothetical protein
MTKAERELLLAVAAVLENILQDYTGDRRDLLAIRRAVATVRDEDVRRAEFDSAIGPFVKLS